MIGRRWGRRTAVVVGLGLVSGLGQSLRAQDGARAPGAALVPVPAPVVAPGAFQRAVERGSRTTDGRPGEAYWQNWSTYQLDARLDPVESRLEGSVAIGYENRSPATLRFVVLHLHQNVHREGAVRNRPQEVTGGIELGRVVAGGQELAARDLREGPGYAVEGTVMMLRPPDTVEPGDTLAIEIDWSMTVPQNGSGRMGHSEREMYFLAYWFPKMAVFDDLRGWDADPFLGSAEFYDGFGDYRASLTVPSGWTVMATGSLENAEEVFTATTRERLAEAAASDGLVTVASLEDLRGNRVTTAPEGGMLTYRFQADSVRDFAWTTSNVQRWDATSALVPDRDEDGEDDRVLIHAFWREDRAPLWEDQWRYGKQSIEHHSRYTGLAYPWPHMTSVEGADIIGGGMEFPMLTLIGPYTGRGAQDLFNVTSHELAHMWVPMVVGSNEKRYAWMDEGSTTFLENQSRMELWPGVDHHRIEAQGYLQTAAAELEQPMMRHGDWYEPGPGYGVASYAKPAALMVALRELMGRERWEQAYRAFIADWAFKHPTPWDFFNTFERHAEEDLDWFWTSFYFETWTLDFDVTEVRAKTGGGALVRVQNRGFAPYPVKVRIRTTLEGVLERDVPVSHWLAGNRVVEFDLPASVGAVTRVEVDPSGYAPDMDRSNNFWPRG